MPPPPPPPAPALPLALAPFKPQSSTPDNRNALLASIQKGAKLKKTVTVDKSGPAITGKSASIEPPRRPTAVPNKNSPDTTSPSNSRPVLDFSSELAQKLTLKKKKASGESPQANTSPVSQDQPDFKHKGSVMINASTKQSISSTGLNANKSTLFANKNPAFEAAKGNISASLFPNATPKIINHGKPNLAPKPPNFQLKLVSDASSDSNNNTSGGTGKQNSVARHHSMKSPRSPPVSLSTAGPFNSDNHFGTIRGNPLLKHQDALNQSLINKQNTPLPSRPLQKPPPPPPVRSISNTNLSQTSAKSTTALNIPSSTETSWSNNSRNLRIAGSSNNLPSLDSVSSHTSDDVKAAPPLPPHRTTRTGGVQNTTSNSNNVNNNNVIPQAPPAPPQRHSSIRNSNNGSNITFSQKHLDNSTDIGKMLVDLDLRYHFHNETDFPKPQRFLDLDKTYPSRSSAVRQSNGGF